MRFLTIFFILFTSIFAYAQSNVGFTLDELQLKRYDSKKKYPATVLRNEPDAFPDLIPVKIYLGKSLYTGKISDEKGSLKIEATVNDGSIIDFKSWDSEETRRQSFHVTTSGMSEWSATDSVYFDNQLFTSGIYYHTAEGNVMMVDRLYLYDNNVLESSYRIGVKYGEEVEYDEPLKDGRISTYHNGTLMYFETFRDGLIDGEVIHYDKNQIVLQRYNVNAMFGLYGTYYEYDTLTDIVTVGHYTDRGIETGQWISKYPDSSLARIQWISESGNPDSSKAWDEKGNLIEVEYNYWRRTKTTGVSDYVHYYKSWYSNGKTHLYINYNPGKSDTIQSFYDITGIIQSVEVNSNGRVLTNTWYTNGYQHIERYGIPSGIPGVTLRDSIFREWTITGELKRQSTYNKGVYIESQTYWDIQKVAATSYTCAYNVAVTQKSANCIWDSCSLVPRSVLDSIAAWLEITKRESRQLKPEAEICFQQTGSLSGAGKLDNPECKYNIVLAQQETVKLDSSGKIVTKNPALNQFLDSLHLLGLGVAPLGHYEKKKGKSVSDYSVTTTDVRAHLNLFYINRRLDQLAPGSSISIYHMPTTKLEPEVIYIPQGEKTSFGPSPVTVIAVAGEGSTRELKVGGRTIQWDNRPFYVFHVYGDGEVEFARTTYKDTILLQYRGERTGVYENPR